MLQKSTDNRSRAWLWSAAAISFIVGIIFLLNDTSGVGLFFILMGITYIGVSTRPGQAWVATNPSLVRWRLVGVTLLLVLFAVVAGAVFLLK